MANLDSMKLSKRKVELLLLYVLLRERLPIDISRGIVYETIKPNYKNLHDSAFRDFTSYMNRVDDGDKQIMKLIDKLIEDIFSGMEKIETVHEYFESFSV